MMDYIASKRPMPEKAGLKIWLPISAGVAALILTAALLAEMRSSLFTVALVGGTVLSLLLSLAIYLAQDARVKEKRLEAKKDELEEEISERVRTWMELDATNRRLEKEITEHQLTEARMLESENLLSHSNARFEAIFNSISDAVIHTDTQRRIVLINAAATRTFGYTYDEMNGKTAEFIYADKADYEVQGMLRYQSGSTTDSQIFTMEYRRKDGTCFTAESLGTQVRSSNGDVLGFIGIHRDITERKRMEGLLLQSQKMEALGHLSSGVAHDFNNILTAVSGYAEILSMKMNKNDPLRRYVEEIAKAGERGNKLISSLLAFARDEEFNLQSANINEIVIAAKQLLLRLLTEDIELEINVKDEPLAVMADCNQIEQVLMNLAVNARDAMPRGGTLSISTELEERSDSFNNSFGGCLCEKGRYAVLTVKDTGSGMDEETKKRIFEPFFTTKEPGKGTGLGLFGAYGIIKRHGGCVEVESEPGAGTAFRIYLPVTDMDEIRAEPEEQAIHANGTETILIADDEREIRASASSLLEELGYHVIEAANGAEAVVKFMENKDSIQLVILDMMMPKKNGKEVFDEIKRVRPDIKTIFASGYTGGKRYA